MLIRARKKPLEVEALEWTGRNVGEMIAFVGPKLRLCASRSSPVKAALAIDTLEGRMEASVGDFIIRGVKGEFYPCKPDVFAETYEVLKG